MHEATQAAVGIDWSRHPLGGSGMATPLHYAEYCLFNCLLVRITLTLTLTNFKGKSFARGRIPTVRSTGTRVC